MQRAILRWESVTEVVIRTVADETGRVPVDLSPIGEVVDPDALDSLFSRSAGTVSNH